MKVNGELKKIFVRDANGKKFYNLCVEVDGEDMWFSGGPVKPAVTEGDVVSFTAEKDGKWWKCNNKEIKREKPAPATAVKSGGGGWNDPDRQKSIVAQSAIKMAIDFIDLAVRTESLVLGTASTKPAKRYEILEETLKLKANEFYTIALAPDGFFADPEDVDDESLEDDDWNPVPD